MSNASLTEPRGERKLDTLMAFAEWVLGEEPDDARHGVVVDTDDGPILVRGTRTAIERLMRAAVGGADANERTVLALDRAEREGSFAVFAVHTAARPRVLCAWFARGAG